MDYIPRGTRFGPLVGEIFSKESVIDESQRCHLWKVIYLFTVKHTAHSTFVYTCNYRTVACAEKLGGGGHKLISPKMITKTYLI